MLIKLILIFRDDPTISKKDLDILKDKVKLKLYPRQRE